MATQLVYLSLTFFYSNIGKKMKKLFYSLPILFLAGCASTSNVSDFESIHLYQSNKPLSTDGQVSIQIPINARFEDTIYNESGENTAAAFKTALEKHAKSVKLLAVCQLNNCLENAKNAGSKYLMILDLVYWEDRATNWSNKADRLTIKVSTYDVSSGALLTASYLHSNTSLGAPSGGHVEDFLPSLASQYASSLY